MVAAICIPKFNKLIDVQLSMYRYSTTEKIRAFNTGKNTLRNNNKNIIFLIIKLNLL